MYYFFNSGALNSFILPVFFIFWYHMYYRAWLRPLVVFIPGHPHNSFGITATFKEYSQKEPQPHAHILLLVWQQLKTLVTSSMTWSIWMSRLTGELAWAVAEKLVFSLVHTWHRRPERHHPSQNVLRLSQHLPHPVWNSYIQFQILNKNGVAIHHAHWIDIFKDVITSC